MSRCFEIAVRIDVALLSCLFVLITDSASGAKPPQKKRAVAANPRTPLAEQIESAGSGDVGPGAQGPRVIRAQILLDRARFSPGEIDGRYGADLAAAIKGFQETHQLPVTGTINAETWKLLGTDGASPIRMYKITAMDVKGPFAPVPKGAEEQAKVKYLGYESAEEGLGEKFHCAPKLLQDLNPGISLSTAGSEILVPALLTPPLAHATRLVVSKAKSTVVVYGLHDKVLAQYPATIGGEHDPLPIGKWTITNIQPYPWFNYDPAHFWNASADAVTAKLPPGPNNPAGAAWIGLSKAHYGIHGTPEPGHVHHGESAGCIRLTNWDVRSLSHMVRRGTPAILEE